MSLLMQFSGLEIEAQKCTYSEDISEPRQEPSAVWCTAVTWWERGTSFSLSMSARGEDAAEPALLRRTGYVSMISKYSGSAKAGGPMNFNW